MAPAFLHSATRAWNAGNQEYGTMKTISQPIARKNGHGVLRLILETAYEESGYSRADLTVLSARSILTASTLHPDIGMASGRPSSLSAPSEETGARIGAGFITRSSHAAMSANRIVKSIGTRRLIGNGWSMLPVSRRAGLGTFHSSGSLTIETPSRSSIARQGFHPKRGYRLGWMS